MAIMGAVTLGGTPLTWLIVTEPLVTLAVGASADACPERHHVVLCAVAYGGAVMVGVPASSQGWRYVLEALLPPLRREGLAPLPTCGISPVVCWSGFWDFTTVPDGDVGIISPCLGRVESTSAARVRASDSESDRR